MSSRTLGASTVRRTISQLNAYRQHVVWPTDEAECRRKIMMMSNEQRREFEQEIYGVCICTETNCDDSACAACADMRQASEEYGTPMFCNWRSND